LEASRQSQVIAQQQVEREKCVKKTTYGLPPAFTRWSKSTWQTSDSWNQLRNYIDNNKITQLKLFLVSCGHLENLIVSKTEKPLKRKKAVYKLLPVKYNHL